MKNYFISFILLMLCTASAWGCDTCGCELCEPGSLAGSFWKSLAATTSQDSAELNRAGELESYLFAGVSTQYTSYHTLRDSGAKIDNTFNEYMDSSITQFIVGCQINNRLSVQLNVPYIYRAYRRQVGVDIQKSHVDGLGDATLSLNFVAIRQETEDWSFRWSVSAGVKFPTGSASFLDEMVNPAFPGSTISGHDLALGSGSYDGIVGTGFRASWNRAFFTGDVEYAIRGTGRVGYRYANELNWSAGPGLRVWQGANFGVSAQLLATGVYKTLDTLQGIEDPDTGITQVSLGPKLLFSFGGGLVATFGVELPVMQHNTGVQAVADYRIKAGIILRF